VLRKRETRDDRNYHPSASESSSDEAGLGDAEEEGFETGNTQNAPDGSATIRRKRKRRIDDPNYRPAAGQDDEVVASLGEPTVTVLENHVAAPTGHKRAAPSSGVEELSAMPEYESEGYEEKPAAKKSRRKSTPRKISLKSIAQTDQAEVRQLSGDRIEDTPVEEEPKLKTKSRVKDESKATARTALGPGDDSADNPPSVTHTKRVAKATPKKAAATQPGPKKASPRTYTPAKGCGLAHR
jgi:hypothetical protein